MKNSSSSRGFTLIEIMIVLAIIGGIIAMAMPYVTNRNPQTKAFLRKFTVMSRELHTRAKLQGAVFRLVIDLGEPDRSGEPPEQKYWIERSDGHTVIKANEEAVDAELLKDADKDKPPKDPRGFAPDSSVLKEPVVLPGNLHFSEVELSRLETPIKEGKAYIHFLPQGLVDEAAVHIKGIKEQAWTVYIQPLTGRGDLIGKDVKLSELKSQ
jgi:general secretion pathway protein H